MSIIFSKQLSKYNCKAGYLTWCTFFAITSCARDKNQNYRISPVNAPQNQLTIFAKNNLAPCTGTENGCAWLNLTVPSLISDQVHYENMNLKCNKFENENSQSISQILAWNGNSKLEVNNSTSFQAHIIFYGPIPQTNQFSCTGLKIIPQPNGAGKLAGCEVSFLIHDRAFASTIQRPCFITTQNSSKESAFEPQIQLSCPLLKSGEIPLTVFSDSLIQCPKKSADAEKNDSDVNLKRLNPNTAYKVQMQWGAFPAKKQVIEKYILQLISCQTSANLSWTILKNQTFYLPEVTDPSCKLHLKEFTISDEKNNNETFENENLDSFNSEKETESNFKNKQTNTQLKVILSPWDPATERRMPLYIKLLPEKSSWNGPFDTLSRDLIQPQTSEKIPTKKNRLELRLTQATLSPQKDFLELHFDCTNALRIGTFCGDLNLQSLQVTVAPGALIDNEWEFLNSEFLKRKVYSTAVYKNGFALIFSMQDRPVQFPLNIILQNTTAAKIWTLPTLN